MSDSPLDGLRALTSHRSRRNEGCILPTKRISQIRPRYASLDRHFVGPPARFKEQIPGSVRACNRIVRCSIEYSSNGRLIWPRKNKDPTWWLVFVFSRGSELSRLLLWVNCHSLFNPLRHSPITMDIPRLIRLAAPIQHVRHSHVPLPPNKSYSHLK